MNEFADRYHRSGRGESPDTEYQIDSFGVSSIFLTIIDDDGEHVIDFSPKQARKLAKRLKAAAATYSEVR